MLASALAQIYVIKLRYFDKLRSGYKRGFQCFAQQQARLASVSAPSLLQSLLAAVNCGC